MKRYKLFDHTADLGIDIVGSTIEELFENAALALVDLLVEQSARRSGAYPELRVLAIEGTDDADLLVNFLREILYLFHGEGFVLASCGGIRIETGGMSAQLEGMRYDAQGHRIRTEIKAVTHHQAAVVKTGQGWRGRIIFDV